MKTILYGWIGSAVVFAGVLTDQGRCGAQRDAGCQAKLVAAQERLRLSLGAALGIEKKPSREATLGHIGLAQADAGDIDGARATAGRIGSDEQAALVLAAVGRAHARRGDGAGAKAALAKAIERIPGVKRERTRELLLHTVLDAHLAGGQYADAERIAAAFPDQLNRTHARLAICQSQLDAGRRNEAKATLDAAAADCQRTLDPFQMMTWEEIWKLYLRLDDVATASKLAHAIPKRHFDACRALCDVAEHQAKAGRAPEAASLFREAFQAAEQIEDQGQTVVKPLHMARVVKAQAETGELEAARQNLRRLPDCREKAEALADLAAARARAGNLTAANATLEEALALTAKWKGYDQVLALAAIADRQAKMGDRAGAVARARQALKSVDEMDSTGWDRGAAVAAVAEVLSQLGDRPSADRALRRAADRAKREPTAAYRADEARQIALAQIELGFGRAAQATLREILLPSLPPKGKYNSGHEEAVLLAKAGDFAGARLQARKAQDSSYQQAAMLAVAAYHAMATGPVEPSAAAEKESDPLLQSALYLGIAVGLLKNCGMEVRDHYGPLLHD